MKELIVQSFSSSSKPFPATSNALVVRHLVIDQTASDVVLGFIRWAIGHPPKDDPDPIAGVTGWTLSLHETKLLRVTDKNGLCVLFDEADELIEENSSYSRIDQDKAHVWKVERKGIPEFGLEPEVVCDPIRLKDKGKEEES